MRRRSRVRPFPVSGLRHFDANQLRLVEQSGHGQWLPPVTEVASRLARSFGLGAAGLKVKRVQVVQVEDLRETFPGRWAFALLADPLSERRGFLALDPVLCGRVLSRLQVEPLAGKEGQGLADGATGALAWVMATALENLVLNDETGAFDGWRFLGLIESAGEIGRANLSEAVLVATWLSVSAGWDRGFAVWLEPRSSIVRREPVAGQDDQVHLDRLALPLVWQVGSARLEAREIEALRCGDVILIQDDQEEEVTLRAGPLLIGGVRRDGRLTVNCIRLQDGGDVMNATDMVDQGNGNGLDTAELSRLPVEITAEAGRIRLTLGQLKKLQVGHVLALPVDVLGPLDLRAGGQLLARGELVEVDGQRGVRLTEMALGGGASDENPA